ncbi:MAG: ribonuclease III [Elusimicrobiota bacterium]
MSIEDAIGYRFRDDRLLREAVTHKSRAYEKGTSEHNERLEFLGDSVLAVVVARVLFDEYPGEDEGRLSKRKAALVSRPTLAGWADRIDLGRYVLLGSGEEATGGRRRPSILANALEALIGAVYVDGGFAAASRVIHACFLDERDAFVERDFKSRFQEMVQKRHKVPPEYVLVKASGPEHDKTFSVKVRMGSRIYGTGHGKTKKEAEQAAASDALKRFKRL